MAGLDMVKGPHWSQILSLFGANGSISDILKDRTQVQLKDKARNLKLFFLKTNSEMPYYLQCVTGELKTRAPGQAARKEAEEKARQNSEEEQARLQGIMTLAGGLQHNHHPVNNPLPAPNTPAHAKTAPMTPQANVASMRSGSTPMTTLAPATPNTGARAPFTPIAQPGAATPSNIGMAVSRTPSISIGAPVTPNAGGGAGRAPYNSMSVPQMSSTTVATPASPVVVKSEPQDQPVLIQPNPGPQPVRSTEPLENANPVQYPRSSPHRPTEQVPTAQVNAQPPRTQLTFPSDTQPPAPVNSAETAQSAKPVTSSVPTPAPNSELRRVQGSAQSPGIAQPTDPTTTTTADHDIGAELAQLANYQAPENHLAQQQPQHHQQNLEVYGTNGDQGHNQHHDKHEHHIHHDHEPSADMTLLQTLQAALAAAPSG